MIRAEPLISSEGKPDNLVADLSEKIANLRSRIYEPITGKRRCYGFRDWEILTENRLLDYSKITETLFGIPSKYVASVDVFGCISNCYFCWVDWENKDKLKGDFYSHEEIFEKLSRLNGNIWRFTGGEPLVVPESTLEISERLLVHNLKKVFWLETNLLPLMVYPNLLKQLSKYKRLVVHCSIKGADSESFELVTGLDGRYYQMSLSALKSLIDLGIEVFPSTLVDSFPPEKLDNLFHDLAEINPKLPLRVMVRKVLPYKATIQRIRETAINLYPFNKCLEHWNQLLVKQYNLKYTQVQRWKIAL